LLDVPSGLVGLCRSCVRVIQVALSCVMSDMCHFQPFEINDRDEVTWNVTNRTLATVRLLHS